MEPTEKDVNDPLFNAVWEAVKLWDISREPASRRLYAEINGTDIMTILCAVRPFVAEALSEGRKRGLEEAVEIVKESAKSKWFTDSMAIEAIEAAIEKEGK